MRVIYRYRTGLKMDAQLNERVIHAARVALLEAYVWDGEEGSASDSHVP